MAAGSGRHVAVLSAQVNLGGRNLLVAPGTRTEFRDSLMAAGAHIETAPAPGGLAFWGGIQTDQVAVASIPSRIGLLERLPSSNEVLIDVAAEAVALLSGGSNTWVSTGDALYKRGWEFLPSARLIHWYQATEFLRRRVDASPSLTTLPTKPVLGAVGYLGSRLNTLTPPIEGLPGLSVVRVPYEVDREGLGQLLESVETGEPAAITTSQGTVGALPKRRLRIEPICIP